MILVCCGTRPEIINLSPTITELERLPVPFKALFIGKYIDLYEDVKYMVPVPDYNMNIIRYNQSLTDIMVSISS